MKQKILLLSLLFFSTLGIKAQDTIVLLDGIEVVSKIEKISDSEIEYRLWDNQDGPLRVTSIKNVFMVKYANGRHEVFINSKNKHNDSNFNSKNEFYGLKTGVQLMRNGNMIVSTDEIKKEPDNLQELLGKKKYDEYLIAKKNAANASSAVALGFLAGIGGVAGIVYGAGNEESVYCIIGVTLAIIGDILIPVGLVDGGINKGRISRIAEGYNDYCGNTVSMSLSVSPSLLVSNGAVATGVGLAVRF